MARRRGQRRGYLRLENGSWLLTYRVRTWDPVTHKEKIERPTVTIGPAAKKGKRRKPGELTEKDAERFAWNHYLAPLDNATIKPFSTLTLGQFWEKFYCPYLEKKKKYATQSQYKSLWKIWIESRLSTIRLFELKPAQIDGVVEAVLAAKSTATAKHAKKVISAIIEYARSQQMFTGENPAQLVKPPVHVPVRRPRAMTLDQCRAWFVSAKDEPADPKDKRSDIKPLRTMSLLGVCCSMGVSEQMGLKWKHVNLTDESTMCDGELLDGRTAAIREHSYHGHGGTLKTGHRVRSIPLPASVVDSLKALQASSPWTSADDHVFAGITGKPIWADNLSKRTLKPLAKQLEMPWLSWHILRHTFATLSKDQGMMYTDRQYLMGHANASMTDRYTHTDWARMREGIEQIASAVTGKPKQGADISNVVVITSRKPANSDKGLAFENLQLTENTGAAS